MHHVHCRSPVLGSPGRVASQPSLRQSGSGVRAGGSDSLGIAIHGQPAPTMTLGGRGGWDPAASGSIEWLDGSGAQQGRGVTAQGAAGSTVTQAVPGSASSRETASQRAKLRALQRKREQMQQPVGVVEGSKPRVRNYNVQDDGDWVVQAQSLAQTMAGPDGQDGGRGPPEARSGSSGVGGQQ